MTYQIALNAVFQFLIVTLISLGISLPLQAAEPDQSEIDWITLANYQELMDTKLATLEAKLQAGDSVSQKDMDALKGLLKAMSADFDRALGQQQSDLTVLEISIALFGLLFTFLSLFGAFVGYFTVKKRAEEQAKEVAEHCASESSKKWLDDRFKPFQIKMQTKMDKFSKDLDSLKSEAEKKLLV